MSVITPTDDELVTRAADGDTDALAAVLDLHLHPAWRIALAAAGDPHAAEAAVVTGVCDALAAAARHPDSTASLRTRIVAAVHRAAAAAPRATARPTTDEPVLAAFATLPVRSRTALWLTEVEGGTPDQVAPVLGLDRSTTAALVDRASAALRDRLAADAALSAGSEDCARALGKLPAHAAGKLTAGQRVEVGAHLGTCGSCAGWLAGAVAIRPALRRLVVPVPDGLPLAIAERWADTNRDRPSWLRGVSERAVGAAAAAVLAIGLAGAAFLGRDGDDALLPGVANPAVGGGTPSGETARTAPLDAIIPASTPPLATGSGTGSVASGTGATPARRSSTPAAPPATEPPATTPTSAPPAATAPPAAPPATQPPAQEPATEPPAAEDGGSEPSATVGVPGVVTVAADPECTGVELAGTAIGCAPEATEEPTAEVQLPGLPPIGLP
jgi:DNA-directed RNA polymerase specialized sigma24 family protein